jgi:hypothetical protein
MMPEFKYRILSIPLQNLLPTPSVPKFTLEHADIEGKEIEIRTGTSNDNEREINEGDMDISGNMNENVREGDSNGGIIGLRENVDQRELEKEKSELLKEKVVYHLQRIFANLSVSEKEYYSMHEFCNNLKGYDGEPINVRVQQDVDEFLNMLCDRIETQMKQANQVFLFLIPQITLF